MRKWDMYDWIFWICETLLGLWIIAKLVGLIHTPLIIEMLPLLTLFFMGGTFYQKIMMKVEHLEHEVQSHGRKLSLHEARLTALQIK